jgi:hypothetical protein
MSVSCQCYVLSDRDLCVRPITRPEETYRMWCICDHKASINEALAHKGLLRHYQM